MSTTPLTPNEPLSPSALPVIGPPVDPGPDQDKAGRLDRSLARGLAWTAGAKWGAQVLSWASTLIVARLLSPGDYGIMGMALVYLGIVQIVSEFGLGTAIVQGRQLDEEQISSIGGLAVISGFALFVISVAAAPILALFFREPAVRLVVITLATTYIITAFQIVPGALLARDLDFRRLAFIDSAEALGQTLVTLGMALGGYGYWALIFGSIAGKVLSSVLMLRARRHRMAWPRQFGKLRKTLTFGWHVVGARLTWYGYSNADFVIIGRVLGKAALGAYTFGWTIASLPADKISGILARVMVPIFAEVQGDRAALRRYLVRLSEALVTVVLPASIGMALVAPDFVRVFLTERWAAAIIPLALLSVHVTVRCVTTLFTHMLVGIGDAKQSLRIGVWLFVVMPVLFLIGAELWGAPGVALMWLVGHPLVTFPSLIMYVSRRIDLPLRSLAEAFGPAVAGTVAMAIVVVLVRLVVFVDTPIALRLALSVAAGALTYPAVMWFGFRERTRSLVGMVQHLRR